jgi:hypothetical protein
LIIFSDNAFSQNKNRYLWAYYLFLTKIGKLDQITINYSIPGHSFMEIDSDFGRIETLIKKREKIFLPSEYATRPKNPFNIIEVNQSFSNINNRPIVKVLNYKMKLNSVLRRKLDHCLKLRIIKIINSGIKESMSLKANCDIEINLFNKKFDINQLNDIFSDVPIAYESILAIKRDKLLDTQLFLKHVQIPTNEKFDETLFSNESAVISKNKALIHDYINENVVIEHKSKRVQKY